MLSSREEIRKAQNLFPFEKMATKHGGVLIHHTGAGEVLDELVSFFSCISCWYPMTFVLEDHTKWVAQDKVPVKLPH